MKTTYFTTGTADNGDCIAYVYDAKKMCVRSAESLPGMGMKDIEHACARAGIQATVDYLEGKGYRVIRVRRNRPGTLDALICDFHLYHPVNPYAYLRLCY